ncbi:YchJ family metal-binding protein [Trichloromonas sp.]|uniref:YchJ family metal-binding protein n=1 Tax=Trichloromonas sp. TaxID=3069249 RepID=UPI003D8155FD
MSIARIGRNDLCPCGSGKKFKKCCLDREQSAASIPADLSPAELVQRRGQAFASGDFAFIYDTYHPDSNFRSQFPDRTAYVAMGKNSLGKDFRIDQCRVLKEAVRSEEARVLFYLDTCYRGQREETFELSLFLLTEAGWRYHSSQKLARADFSGPLEAIDWVDFEQVKDKVFF